MPNHLTGRPLRAKWNDWLLYPIEDLVHRVASSQSSLQSDWSTLRHITVVDEKEQTRQENKRVGNAKLCQAMPSYAKLCQVHSHHWWRCGARRLRTKSHLSKHSTAQDEFSDDLIHDPDRECSRAQIT